MCSAAFAWARLPGVPIWKMTDGAGELVGAVGVVDGAYQVRTYEPDPTTATGVAVTHWLAEFGNLDDAMTCARDIAEARGREAT